jgi:hypothetical protein
MPDLDPKKYRERKLVFGYSKKDYNFDLTV